MSVEEFGINNIDFPFGLLVSLGREDCPYQDDNLNCTLNNCFCPYVADEDCKKRRVVRNHSS